ncbi:MAG: cupredoxin domain-containing protein [Proteobacteria bacterium]|nr:cupredoxin domain-containing protein [Pseudomonadota bacterium]
MRISLLLSILVGVFSINSPVLAADEPQAVLQIEHQQFAPNQLSIPAGAKIKLVIRNLDAVPVEFESPDLSREVIVRGHGEITIFVGPLEPGNYQFFNDFNREMQGSIAVKPVTNKGN